MNALEHTGRITLEISNRCNYAYRHKKCPLHGQIEPSYISEHVVREIMAFLDKQQYTGIIAFHNYCEPLMDPRLFMFLDLCPQNCKILIMTNGFMINQQLFDELVAHGVTQLDITSYSDKEYERVAKIKRRGIGLTIRQSALDDRLTIYDKPPININKPCSSPLWEIIVRSDGNIPLCCFDWNNKHVFGNVNTTPLREILLSDSMQNTYSRLRTGDRFLHLCRRCADARP